MLQVAQHNTLQVLRLTDIGAYLQDGADGVLLPKRYVPTDIQVGDSITVFIYHDSENRLIATTDVPLVTVGQIAYLKCESTTAQGAFLQWGLVKDIFVPNSQQQSNFYQGQYYFVQIYIDAQTGRAAATEKWEATLTNETLTTKELQPVNLLIYRETNIGYMCIVNHLYLGLLHFADVYKSIYIGDTHQGYIKKIYPNTHKLDLVIGKPGYQKVTDASSLILQLLTNNNGYLPYHDKSEPEEIQAYFGMSKKAFKMTVGALYKEKKITLTGNGINLI